MTKSSTSIWKSILTAVVAAAMILMLGVPAMAAKTGSFSDVPSGKWYTQAVTHCAQKGYVSGYEDGTFRPNNKLTRAEMAVIMNKMLGLTKSAKNTFEDVASGKWYTEAVLHCVKAGIMTGYSATVFGLKDTLTREQGAVILAKAFQVKKISGRTGFSDDASISKWAVESVKAMSAKGLITGMGNNQFAPKTPLTRAQMCQIIYAAQGKSGNEEHEENKPGENEEKPSPNPRNDPSPSDMISPDEQVEIQVGDVEEQTTRKDWNTIQKEYMKEKGVVGSEKIDVDGDAVKEVLTYGEEQTGNVKLITYHDGRVSALPLNGASVAYVPGDNKILIAEYIDSTYYLTIYSIENGVWTKKSVGSFQVESTDEEGDYVFTNCKWDGKSVELVDFFEIMAEKIDVEKMIQIHED